MTSLNNTRNSSIQKINGNLNTSSNKYLEKYNPEESLLRQPKRYLKVIGIPQQLLLARLGVRHSPQTRNRNKISKLQNGQDQSLNNEEFSHYDDFYDQLKENVEQIGYDELNPPNFELEKCEGCNRKFKKESYLKHLKICQKLFQGKRNTFDSKQKRLKSIDYQEHGDEIQQKQIETGLILDEDKLLRMKQKQLNIEEWKNTIKETNEYEKEHEETGYCPQWKIQSQLMRAFINQEESIKYKNDINQKSLCKYCCRRFDQKIFVEHQSKCKEKNSAKKRIKQKKYE